MPDKERLKTSLQHIRKKRTYKVVNWTNYNKSLKKRGQLSLYFPQGDLKDLFVNDSSYEKGLRGLQSYYRTAYVELICIFYRLFNWGMRQITGYFEDFWKNKGLAITVPSFGPLSHMFASLSLAVRHYCDKVIVNLQKGDPCL
jgi:hypothetical protein